MATCRARITERHSPGLIGAILAGGRSSRFGAPKLWARVGGVPVAERLRRAIVTAGLHPVLVTNDPERDAPLGVAMRPDINPGAGPLAGLQTALRWAREREAPGAICLACDLPFVPAGLLRELAERGMQNSADGVVPATERCPEGEPLCGWFSVRLLPALEDRLQAGRRSVSALLRDSASEVLPLAAVRAHGEPENLLLNLNTPQDHARAERLAPAHPPAVLEDDPPRSG